ncbi:MAG TPA: hypothetical protein VHE35_31185 [Kofleriaceae bacterium]|nr:hypothetical protein [Kofleriaceae bacterium]
MRQPNPLEASNETLRVSEPVVIVTGDMDLEQPRQPDGGQQQGVAHNEHYPLENVATFTLVSRDRLRFHLQIDHKWQEWADPTSWDVYMVDDQGHEYLPESVEHVNTRHLVSMWDREVQTAQRNVYGDIVALNNDGWKNRQSLGSLSVFRGTADFVFYKRDIFTPELRKLTLVVRRSEQAFHFTWRFSDRVAAN